MENDRKKSNVVPDHCHDLFYPFSSLMPSSFIIDTPEECDNEDKGGYDYEDDDGDEKLSYIMQKRQERWGTLKRKLKSLLRNRRIAAYESISEKNWKVTEKKFEDYNSTLHDLCCCLYKPFAQFNEPNSQYLDANFQTNFTVRGRLITHLVVEKHLAVTNWIFMCLKNAVALFKKNHKRLREISGNNKTIFKEVIASVEKGIKLCGVLHKEYCAVTEQP